jgi:SatD family (SatD)
MAGAKDLIGQRCVAVLGDVVSSREHPDHGGLQRLVREALEHANARVSALQPLTPTIGDEFQGLYDHLDDALEATLLVRLALLDDADVRFGIGSGTLLSFDRERAPFEQDGPAWWSARQAVDHVRDVAQRQEMPRGLRTRWVDADGNDPGRVAAVNAFLLCRDELVAAMDARDAATMSGILRDEPLRSIAEAQGVSVSALSQRAIRGGLYAIRHAHRELREAAT